MNARQAVKACVFDAYGTLFDVHSPAAALASELGDRGPEISNQWRTKQLEYTWLRSLMGLYVDFAQVTADALDYVLAANGLGGSPVRDKLLSLYVSLSAYPDAIACLEALKAKGARTGILSNGSPSMLASAVTSARLGPLLDYVISVDSVRTYKPSPAVYNLAPNALGVEIPAIAFVSANGWDCAGAAAFGFRVIHVNRTKHTPELLGVRPEAEVPDLKQAADLLIRMLA
ncbi:MAG: haloacid dehalogenase type II [Rhodomicrobium sp.]